MVAPQPTCVTQEILTLLAGSRIDNCLRTRGHEKERDGPLKPLGRFRRCFKGDRLLCIHVNEWRRWAVKMLLFEKALSSRVAFAGFQQSRKARA